MTEKEILEKLKQSAEAVMIPESLAPDKILEKCRNLEQEKTGERREWRKKFLFGNPKLAGGLTAAAVFIICCISLWGMQGMKNFEPESGMAEGAAAADTTMSSEACMMDEAAGGEAGAGESAAQEGGADAGAKEKEIDRKNAGDLYILAESYEAVYKRLDKIKEKRDMSMDGGDMADGAAMAEDSLSTGRTEEMRKEMTVEEAAGKESGGHSETNVQTFGIDESDVVKTDGEYIYLLRGSKISIISAAEDEMKLVGELEADPKSASADICAMYVDGDLLILAVQESLTALNQADDGEDMAYYDIRYMDTDMTTSVLTYDISDRSNPVLAGKMTQDGSYVTSRKDGSIFYLFTGKYLLDDYEKKPADAIPEVNARKIAEDCIYMGEQGERALIVSSLSVNRPGEPRDSVMILDNGSEVYMGEDSLYLYRANYQGMSETTEIARFSLTAGYMNGEAAVSVRGTIRDTFAIHEKDKKLRVLTTDASGRERENCLFLLDEKLKLTGKLTGIAAGESIYAARYLGDMAYFITYRNTDPLFAADLSDEKNPKLVGELEITGFSEYLHFWGEDKLLGIGYETDSKSGEQKGLKLVMFDMSDPADLKVLGSRVLKEAAYSPAIYDYKAVLAEPGENLIGFVTENYGRNAKRMYELYQWNGESFERILAENLGDKYGNENYRGIYSGDRFYIAHPEIVRYYDRADYGLKQTLEAGQQ